MKERRYYRLLQLTSLLYELQSQDRVRHDYKQEIASRLQSRSYTELLDLLIRQMTLLNRVYRQKENGVYKSERSDLVMAIQLLESDLKGQTLINPVIHLCYERIKKRLGSNRIFTRRDIEKLTGYKRTRSLQILRTLESSEKIERKGGNRRTGYYYQLVD